MSTTEQACPARRLEALAVELLRNLPGHHASLAQRGHAVSKSSVRAELLIFPNATPHDVPALHPTGPLNCHVDPLGLPPIAG